MFRTKRSGAQAAPPGEFQSYVQRGATIQTYRPLGHIATAVLAVTAQVIDTLIAVPFPLATSCRMDRLGFNCSVAAAGSSARVGLYRSISKRNVYPGALVIGTAAISTAAAGWKEENVDLTLTPGLYWSVYLAGVLAPSVHSWSIAGAIPYNPILGWTAANPPVAQHSLRVAFAFAALPATFPGGAAYSTLNGVFISGRFSA